VFLDAETACYGDPAFDLAFCLNHLLLKCLWHPEYSADYLASLKALARSYLQNVTWESAGSIEARTAALLPALLLARIDGKSPVEYITSQRDKDFVRIAGTRLLSTNSVSLNAIAAVWRDALAAR